MKKMRTYVLGTVAALMFASTPVLAQNWSGSSTPEELLYRLDILDAEIADIRARLGGAGGAAPAAPSGDVMLRLDRLEAEIRKLTGKVEELTFSQSRIAEDAARRFGDIEFRLTELEGGDISTLGEPEPLGGGAAQPQAQASSGGSSGGVPTNQVLAEVSISEQGDLDRAVRDVQQGRFDQGEDRLRGFLTTYPGSPLSPVAYFWLGESQFIRGNYQDAARSFLDGYNADQSAERAPHSLYRLGVTLGRLGQINEACLTLREVRNQYPNGPQDLIGKADEERDQLACG